MARVVDVAQVQEELVRAFKLGDEEQARTWVLQLGAGPRQVRAVLEAMLRSPEGLVRQAAAFGLGELGGAASVKRLEEQLAIEEARGDHDGDAVLEDITRALGRLQGAKARAVLVRRLERLVAGKPDLTGVNEVAEALWKKRHPELIPVVRQSLEKLTLPAPHGLHDLLVLLEKSPEELDAWARDPSVSLKCKRGVLAVMQEAVPDALIPVLRGFLATAQAVSARAERLDEDAEAYFERLFSVLLQERERFLTEEVRSVLRDVALQVIAATSPHPPLRAAYVLQFVGRSEDAAFLDAHCPQDPTFAKVFRDAAQALRGLRKA